MVAAKVSRSPGSRKILCNLCARVIACTRKDRGWSVQRNGTEMELNAEQSGGRGKGYAKNGGGSGR